jgi:hypothetical protein
MDARTLLEYGDEWHSGYSRHLRFDANVRAEIFISQEDLEDECAPLRESLEPFAEKVKKAKLLALNLADKRLNEVGEVQLTGDLSLKDLNIDTIDWHKLLDPEAPEEEEEGAP